MYFQGVLVFNDGSYSPGSYGSTHACHQTKASRILPVELTDVFPLARISFSINSRIQGYLFCHCNQPCWACSIEIAADGVLLWWKNLNCLIDNRSWVDCEAFWGATPAGLATIEWRVSMLNRPWQDRRWSIRTYMKFASMPWFFLEL